MAREMKHSGIEWIGEIPKEWKLSRLKYYSSFINGFAFNSDVFTLEFGCKVIRIGDISQRLDFEKCVRANVKTELLQPYRINNNDIVIAMSGATTGKCCVAHNVEEAYINQRVGIIRCKNYSYIYYLLQTDSFMEYIKLNNAGSAQPNVSGSSIGNYPLLVPPLSEQQKIASYLDKVCGEVDEMIALQEQMIEELKAYKQSVITEAVTKGLNPDVPMKDSGIDWIGDIPEEWKVVKLSLLTSKIGSGSTPTGGANVYVSEGVKFLRSQNVYFEGLDLSEVAHITDNIDEEMKGTRVLPGDVLLNITGGSIGRCYYVDETLGKANVNQHVSIIRPKTIDTKYLKYSLQSSLGQEQVSLFQTGGNREGLSAAALSNFRMLLPSKDEQQSIASYLDAKCAEIDALIAIKQAKIDELKDYKKSVIYEYVTGKKEVV